MRKRFWRKVIVVFLFASMITISGCGKTYTKDEFGNQLEKQLEKQEKADEEKGNQADEIYDSISKKTEDSYYSAFEKIETTEGESGTADKWLWGLAFGVYQNFIHYIPGIIIVSVFSGFVLFGIARQNKKVQRFAIFGLVIGVPAMIIALYIGIALWSTAA